MILDDGEDDDCQHYQQSNQMYGHLVNGNMANSITRQYYHQDQNDQHNSSTSFVGFPQVSSFSGSAAKLRQSQQHHHNQHQHNQESTGNNIPTVMSTSNSSCSKRYLKPQTSPPLTNTRQLQDNSASKQNRTTNTNMTNDQRSKNNINHNNNNKPKNSPKHLLYEVLLSPIKRKVIDHFCIHYIVYSNWKSNAAIVLPCIKNTFGMYFPGTLFFL